MSPFPCDNDGYQVLLSQNSLLYQLHNNIMYILFNSPLALSGLAVSHFIYVWFWWQHTTFRSVRFWTLPITQCLKIQKLNTIFQILDPSPYSEERKKKAKTEKNSVCW